MTLYTFAEIKLSFCSRIFLSGLHPNSWIQELPRPRIATNDTVTQHFDPFRKSSFGQLMADELDIGKWGPCQNPEPRLRDLLGADPRKMDVFGGDLPLILALKGGRQDMFGVEIVHFFPPR